MKNFYLYFFVIVVFAASCNNSPKRDKIHTVKSADSTVVFVSINKKDRINWKQYEVQVSGSVKVKLKDRIKKHFQYYLQSEMVSKPFEETLHFIDLNGDKNLDVIFEGWSGGESDITKILINKNNDFQIVFEGFQYLKRLNIKNGKLTSFTLLDFGCCAEYVWSASEYDVNQKFQITANNSIAITSFTELPKKRNKRPKTIQLKNPAFLRSSPQINDTEIVIYDVEDGNRLAEYPKLAKGYTWEEQVDKDGNTWLFVEMYPTMKIKSQVFDTEDYIFGWIRKEDLQLE